MIWWSSCQFLPVLCTKNNGKKNPPHFFLDNNIHTLPNGAIKPIKGAMHSIIDTGLLSIEHFFSSNVMLGFENTIKAKKKKNQLEPIKTDPLLADQCTSPWN